MVKIDASSKVPMSFQDEKPMQEMTSFTLPGLQIIILLVKTSVWQNYKLVRYFVIPVGLFLDAVYM